MAHPICSALIGAVFLAGCAATTPPPPPPITAEQFATYKLTDVVVDTADTEVTWPAVEREYTAAQGITEPSNGGDFNAYDTAIKSDAAKALYRERAKAAMTPHLRAGLAPAFTGEKPLTMEVDLEVFTIQSTGAVAFGADEGAIGLVRFIDPATGAPIAQTQTTFVSSNDIATGGGLAGLAIGFAVSAAVNMATDAFENSEDVISQGFTNKTREWMQLPEHVYTR